MIFAFLLLSITIPATRTTTLAGHPFEFPGSLQGDSILILGFTQKSAQPMRDWTKGLASVCDESQGLSCVEMPVLESVPRLFRSLVLHGIGKEVPDHMKESFAPVFEHEDQWKRVVDYSAPDDAYVLLVDKSGNVKWKAHGPVSEQKLRELRTAANG